MSTIKIHGCGSELQGVGRLDDGRAVFVPGALPDELVRVRITKNADRFCEARLVEVIEPAACRTQPACAHYGLCGGCQSLHMDYEASLSFKHQRVYDALRRIGGIDAPVVHPVIGCADPYHTRNKAEYAIGHNMSGKLVIGTYVAGSKQIVEIEDCLLQKPQSIAALKWFSRHLSTIPGAGRLRYLVTRVNRVDEMMLTISGEASALESADKLADALFRELPNLCSVYYCQLNQQHAHALDGRCQLIRGQRALADELLGLRFELAPQAFFQVNPVQAEVLYQKALKAAGLDDEASDMRVADIYCGAGTITLAAARRAAFVTGIEIVAPAVQNAKENARRNGLDKNTEFVCGDAAKVFPRLMHKEAGFDTVILDPPRKGADRPAVDALVQNPPKRIVYVSCNPATLARDVKLLSEKYQLKWAQPVDMFPGTAHVETVVLMIKE